MFYWKTVKDRKLSTRNQRVLHRKVKGQIFENPEIVKQLQSERDGLDFYDLAFCSTHDMIGWATATKMMLRAKTERLKNAERDESLKPFFGSSLCLQTSADSNYAATVAFGYPEVRMEDISPAVRYHRRSLHFWGTIAYDDTAPVIEAPKNPIRRTISPFWENLELSFSRNWDTSGLTINLPQAVNECKTPNGIEFVPVHRLE